ncbi:MAG: hypothetical protein AAB911_02025 [Patescibacteria group bacterium]
MSTKIITRKTVKVSDFITIPRVEYEALLGLKEVKEFNPTPAQKRALVRARKNFSQGKYVTLEQLKYELANRS